MHVCLDVCVLRFAGSETSGLECGVQGQRTTVYMCAISAVSKLGNVHRDCEAPAGTYTHYVLPTQSIAKSHHT